jgi:hypothetical protein
MHYCLPEQRSYLRPNISPGSTYSNALFVILSGTLKYFATAFRRSATSSWVTVAFYNFLLIWLLATMTFSASLTVKVSSGVEKYSLQTAIKVVRSLLKS